MPSAVKDSLPSTDVAGATAATASIALEEEENDEEEDEMQARLEALRSQADIADTLVPYYFTVSTVSTYSIRTQNVGEKKTN